MGSECSISLFTINYFQLARSLCQGQFKIYPQTRMEVKTHHMWPVRAHKFSTALCTKHNQMSYNRYLLYYCEEEEEVDIYCTGYYLHAVGMWTERLHWTRGSPAWGSVTFELFKLVVFNFSHPNCWWKLLFLMTTNRRGNTIYKAMNGKGI